MNLREKIIRASFLSGACHIGSALSVVEIIEAVYEVKKKEDIFLFAKATGVAALYCYLHPLEKAWKYLKKYPLPSRKVPGVLWTGGSCGQGLSVAVGMALAKKLNKEKGKVYCLISDGELNEGQVWEAIQFAGHHKLKNLVVIVDNNGFQALGATEDIIRLFPIGEKFRVWGWNDVSINGHDKIDLRYFLRQKSKLPKVIVANTVKGKGVNFCENNNAWHYRNLSEEDFKNALKYVG